MRQEIQEEEDERFVQPEARMHEPHELGRRDPLKEHREQRAGRRGPYGPRARKHLAGKRRGDRRYPRTLPHGAEVHRPAAERGLLRREHEGRAVVSHVGDHQREDDRDDEEALEAEGHSLRLDDNPIVEKDEGAADDEHPENVLYELVALAERLPRPEHPQVERRVVSAAPEHDLAEVEEHEPREDRLVGDSGGIVVIHFLLPERERCV